MNVTLRIVFLVTTLLVFDGNAQPVKKLVTPNFENAYKVNDKIYRSEQPSAAGFMYLDSLGIATFSLSSKIVLKG